MLDAINFVLVVVSERLLSTVGLRILLMLDANNFVLVIVFETLSCAVIGEKIVFV